MAKKTKHTKQMTEELIREEAIKRAEVGGPNRERKALTDKERMDQAFPATVPSRQKQKPDHGRTPRVP